MYLRPDSVFGVFVRRLKAALDGSSFSRLSDIYDEVMRYSASLRGDRPQHTLCLNRLGVPNPCGLLKNSLSAAPVVGGGLHTAVTPAFFTGAPAVEPSPASVLFVKENNRIMFIITVAVAVAVAVAVTVTVNVTVAERVGVCSFHSRSSFPQLIQSSTNTDCPGTPQHAPPVAVATPHPLFSISTASYWSRTALRAERGLELGPGGRRDDGPGIAAHGREAFLRRGGGDGRRRRAYRCVSAAARSGGHRDTIRSASLLVEQAAYRDGV